MNFSVLRPVDVANGTGVRVSIFVSGCPHKCLECFNPETWDYNYGREFTKEDLNILLNYLAPDYINGLTLLGGEPFAPQNQETVCEIVTAVRNTFGNKKSIWSYTGYIYEKDLLEGGRAYTKHTDEILNNLDVLVDGPFVLSKKNLSLRFRGSENQRIIDVVETRKTNSVILKMA